MIGLFFVPRQNIIANLKIIVEYSNLSSLTALFLLPGDYVMLRGSDMCWKNQKSLL